ncbi:MAG TPA: hypothetical protein VGG22_14965 [Candidatus Baltobacteraceae bacterium]|jgi:hypothetical protein
MGDPAIFEYIGHSITRGAHLYTDLWDNKLPSIYYVNALWWLAFGADYRLHALAESAINAGTFALFALIARTLGVTRWAAATLVFALLYLFVGGALDQTEQYATPLILAGILLGLRRQGVLAAVALVAASTFWLPAIVVGIVPLFAIGGRRERLELVLMSIVATMGCAVAFAALFGPSISSELVRSWFSYQAGNYVTADSVQVHRYPFPFLSPRYYIESGLGVMLCMIAIFWTHGRTRALRFTLWWSVATLAIVFALGRPSIHFFLPLYAPLVLVLGLQTLDVHAFLKRWYFSSVAVVCAALMIVFAVRDSRRDFFGTPAAITYTGDLVRDAFGPRVVALLPWEIYLTSDAVPPSRFFLAQGNVKFAKDRDLWVREPTVFVDAADLRFNGVQPPDNLRFVCRNSRTLPYVIHAERPISGISCEHT